MNAEVQHLSKPIEYIEGNQSTQEVRVGKQVRCSLKVKYKLAITLSRINDASRRHYDVCRLYDHDPLFTSFLPQERVACYFNDFLRVANRSEKKAKRAMRNRETVRLRESHN